MLRPKVKSLRASLDLIFTGPTLDSRINFSRASTGTYVGSDGRLKTAAYNLLTWSQDFTNAAWNKSGCTVTPNYSVAPDGSNSATQVAFSGPSNGLYHYSGAINGQVYSGALWVRGTSGETIQLSAVGGDVLFTLTGVWQRLLTQNKTASNSSLHLNTYGGATARTVQIWGAQLEVGSVATNYILTTSSPNGAPRFDFDPTVQVGTNGVELAPSLSSAGWTAQSGWTFNSGTAVKDASGASSLLLTSSPLTVGCTYRLTTSLSAAMNYVNGGRYLGVSAGANFVTYFTATAADFAIQGNGAPTTLSSLSIQQVVFAPLGQLIEEQRTNLLLWSQDFTKAAWVKTLGVITTGVYDPQGGATASTFTALSNGAELYQFASTTAGAIGAIAVFIRRRTGNGTVRLSVDGTNLIDVSSQVGSTWKRIFVTQTVSASISYFDIKLGLSGDAVDIWQADLQPGAFITSPIPTTSTQVTRAADIMSIPTSGWFNPSQGTFAATSIYTEFPSDPAALSTSPGGCGFNNPGKAQWWNGSSNVTSPNNTNQGITTKEAFAYTSYSRTVCMNGGSVVSDANVPWLATPTSLNIGSTNGTAQFLNGHIKRITYYPRALSSAQLQALTS